MSLTATVLVGEGDVIQGYVPRVALPPAALEHNLEVLGRGEGHLTVLPLESLVTLQGPQCLITSP